MTPIALSLDDPRAQDPALTGGKGATLARITVAGLPVPRGFVVSTAALHTDVIDTITRTFANLVPSDLKALQEASDRARATIAADLTSDLSAQILTAYNALGAKAVSVRSSSTAEDLAQASFAGQYQSFLNVRGASDLLAHIQRVWASLYSPHAIGYRQRHHRRENHRRRRRPGHRRIGLLIRE